MAGLLPLVRGGAGTCCYGTQRSVRFSTSVAMAVNGSEQRARRRPPLTSLTLPYSHLLAADVTLLRNFWQSQKGGFDSSWGVVIGKVSTTGTVSGTSFTDPSGKFSASDVGADVVTPDESTYVGKITAYGSPTSVTVSPSGGATGEIRWGYHVSNLTFDDDNFAVSESSPQVYDLSLKCHQTKNPGCTAGSPGGTFPVLSAGVRAQHPFTQTQRFQNLQSENKICGVQYSYAFVGGGLSGFATDAIPGWVISYPVLTDADLRTLENFVRCQYGAWSSFTFIEPKSETSFDHCRFTDDFSVTHADYNRNSVSITIIQTNGS